MVASRRFLLLFAVLAPLACADPVAAPADAADVPPADTDASTDAPDAQPADLQPADVPTTDVPTADVAADIGPLDVPLADVGAEIDAAPEVAGDDGCGALMTQIDALKPKLTPCSAGTTCQMFEYPICNTMGCFQTPVASNADTSALSSLTQQAGAAQCPGFHCGCGPYAPAFCLNSQCQQCPPNCDGTCDEVTAALLTTAHADNWCGIDKDCAVLSTGLCPVGDLPCGGMYLNVNASQENLQGLLGGYSKACGASFCKCAAPGPAVCVKGKCVKG